jgi:multidrug efflux pump subunit AcrA (membrane-fusion protein)
MKTSLFTKRIAALAGALVLSAVPFAFPHEGHDKAPGEEGEAATSGPIAITAEAKTNLALKVEEAKLRKLEKTFIAIGQIEPIPSRAAAVTSRIAGRVVDIKATEGQTVKKGDPLVEVESRQVGNPPPRVQYPAPIDGIVTRRDVLINGAVEPDKNLLEIVDLSEVYAEGQVFEGQVAQVRAGQKVRVRVESFPDLTFEGAVDLVSGVLEPETRTLRIWVRVANPEGKLRPNMRATLHIVTAGADEVVAIPHSAVLGEAGNLFAFVQADKEGLVYERRPVVTGIKDDQYVEITEGIFEGDKVVTLGNYQLQYVTTRAKPAGATGEAHEDAPGAAPHGHGEKAAAKGISRFARPLLIAGAIVALLVIVLAVARSRRRARENEYVSPSAPVPQPRVPHETGTP